MEHLIPQTWFTGQPWWLLTLIGVAAMYFVIKGADWLVEGASGGAMRLGISKVIVGATIVSLGTTSPECAVSVMAAFGGNSGLALGNAVGSIIADTGLIFGLGCLLTALPADSFVLNRQGWVQFGVAILLAGISYAAWFMLGPDAAIGRWVGVLLLAILVWYLWISVRWGKQHTRMTSSIHPQGDTEQVIEHVAHDPWGKLIIYFILGLVLVLLFGRVLIACVTEGASQAGIPDVVIAGTIVALGTSLPELMVGITAIRRGHGGLLVGNVIGADILNVLFVIGASAAATPLQLENPGTAHPAIFLTLHLPTMLLVLVLFRLFIFSAARHGRFHRWFGVPLVAIYLAYLVLNYVMG